LEALGTLFGGAAGRTHFQFFLLCLMMMKTEENFSPSRVLSGQLFEKITVRMVRACVNVSGFFLMTRQLLGLLSA